LVEGWVAGGWLAGGWVAGGVVSVVVCPVVVVLEAVFIRPERLANQMIRPKMTSAPMMMPIHELELRRSVVGVVVVDGRSS
jgi:hypothetical protein